MEEQRYYYNIVELDDFGNYVCTGTLDTFKERTDTNYIPTEVYDETVVGRKMWTGTEWVDNPNYVPPQPEEPVTV